MGLQTYRLHRQGPTLHVSNTSHFDLSGLSAAITRCQKSCIAGGPTDASSVPRPGFRAPKRGRCAATPRCRLQILGQGVNLALSVFRAYYFIFSKSSRVYRLGSFKPLRRNIALMLPVLKEAFISYLSSEKTSSHPPARFRYITSVMKGAQHPHPRHREKHTRWFRIKTRRCGCVLFPFSD